MWNIVRQVKRPGSDVGEFDYARGIRVSSDTGNVVIADINNKRIQILDGNGEYLHHWLVEIKGMKFCPLDVHRLDRSHVIGAIEGHAAIWETPDVENYSGVETKLIHSFGNDIFVFPRSVISNERNQLFITDVGKHRMTSHDMKGNVIRSIGGLGSRNTQFNWPYYTCRDDKGRVVVSDSHNRCVKLFDRDLNFITSFGQGHFACSTGVTYSSAEGGSFVVGDYDKESILRFSADGKFMEFLDASTGLPCSSTTTGNNGEILAAFQDGFRVYKRNT